MEVKEVCKEKNYYAVVGVEEDESTGEIIGAFKKESKGLHQDKNLDESMATVKFQQSLKAKRVLINEQLIKIHDKHEDGEKLATVFGLLNEDSAMISSGDPDPELIVNENQVANNEEELPEDQIYVDSIERAVKILDETFYKIKWRSHQEMIWQPAVNLLDCQDKLDEFHKLNGMAVPELAGGAGSNLLNLLKEGGFNIDNWISVEEALEYIEKYSKLLKADMKLEVGEFNKFENKDKIYLLVFNAHLFVLLNLEQENIVYISDGNNTYARNETVQKSINKLLETNKNITILPIENNFQIKKDHCGSAAILAAIGFRVWYKNKIGKPQLKNISKWLRTTVRKIHKEKSERINGCQNNINNIERLKCPECGKPFGYSRVKLAAHYKIHKK